MRQHPVSLNIQLHPDSREPPTLVDGLFLADDDSEVQPRIVRAVRVDAQDLARVDRAEVRGPSIGRSVHDRGYQRVPFAVSMRGDAEYVPRVESLGYSVDVEFHRLVVVD